MLALPNPAGHLHGVVKAALEAVLRGQQRRCASIQIDTFGIEELVIADPFLACNLGDTAADLVLHRFRGGRPPKVVLVVVDPVEIGFRISTRGQFATFVLVQIQFRTLARHQTQGLAR